MEGFIGSMESVPERIAKLRHEGYKQDFTLVKDHLEDSDHAYKIFHDDFCVDAVFRFDEDSDPAGQAILYAISSDKYNMKGILIDGYGIYSEEVDDTMLGKLREL